ncbi:ABC transporter substrate-binding protein [Galbitalea sp. SE-J8]|uniref:ABC transporter substrate-binding protein n=1 Tax=Galbitalea sp. SE-J8 TaxID=3054952 RepID=UPI00259CAB68|nr:ABC transporter substrate-binding protein [Galbitalea sp. SE-J8]MDM4761612.1 ABC transporter substrate-binding protein [Galbitalea sp. SE-J8]
MSDENTPTPAEEPALTEKKKPTGSRRGLIAGIVVAAVVVVGAGIGIPVAINANSGSGSSTGGGDSDGGDAAPAAAVNADATLRVGLRLEPTSLDIRTVSGAALDQILIDNVYEGLVSRDATGDISPSLATDWTVSDDGLTYTFTLAPDETFSNGDALTADDVVWSIQGLIDAKGVNSGDLGKVTDVAADGDTTVTITLSDRDPELLYSLAGRAGLVLDQDATNEIATTAIGSGPFLLDSWKQGDSITLTRNDDYWGEEPQLKSVVFSYYTDATAGNNAILAGDLDVLTGVDANTVSQFDGVDGLSVVDGSASDKFVLAFNNAKAPLNDEKVRQAIRSAIDHEAIITAVGGAGKVLGGPITSNDPGYEDLSGLYPHDVDKAKSLLADAGYADGLDLTLTIPSFYGTTVTDLLTSQLAEAGITLTVNSVEFSTWLSDVYTNKDYELSIVDHAEARDFKNWANPDYYFGYDNATVQDLYAQASSAASTDEEADLLQQAAKIVSEDAAADWLYNSTGTTIVADTVHDFPTDSTSSRLDVTGVTVTD